MARNISVTLGEHFDKFISDLKEIVKDPQLLSDQTQFVHFLLVASYSHNIKQDYAKGRGAFFKAFNRDFDYGQLNFVTFLSNDYWADQNVKNFIHRKGIFKAWQTAGFPSFCKPVGDDDFECKTVD